MRTCLRGSSLGLVLLLGNGAYISAQPVNRPAPFLRRPIPQAVHRPPFPLPIVINSFLTPLLVAFVAVIAEQERRKKRQEEEVKTAYTEEDLMDDWEFKIIRSSCGRFERRESLDRFLHEEGRAGWRLVEKFDGMRVRLKRRLSDREGDSGLPTGYDPYRTVIPPRPTCAMALSWILFGVSAAFLPLFPVMLGQNGASPGTFRALMIGTASCAVVFGTLAIIMTKRFKEAL